VNPAMAAVIGVLVGYLLGAIPVGLVIGRIAGVEDLRAYGSGKTGFTNALRSLGLRWAVLVMAGDIAKGAAAVLICRMLVVSPWAGALAGAAAVLGHIFPVFAGWRGGRGVSTAFGAFLAVAPPAALVVVIFSALILAVSRYASLMSVVGVFTGFVVVVALVLTHNLAAEYLVFALLTMLAVEFSHVENIRRLLAGTEPKLGQGGARRTPVAH
jgi:glycerol-3-phosphate acyltransferase PlsY